MLPHVMLLRSPSHNFSISARRALPIEANNEWGRQNITPESQHALLTKTPELFTMEPVDTPRLPPRFRFLLWPQSCYHGLQHKVFKGTPLSVVASKIQGQQASACQTVRRFQADGACRGMSLVTNVRGNLFFGECVCVSFCFLKKTIYYLGGGVTRWFSRVGGPEDRSEVQIPCFRPGMGATGVTNHLLIAC